MYNHAKIQKKDNLIICFS